MSIQIQKIYLETLVRGIITSSCQRDDYLQALSSGLYPHSAFQLKLYEFSHEALPEAKKPQIIEGWKRMLNHLRQPYLIFFQQDLLLAILFHKNPDDDFSIPERLWKKLPDDLKPTSCGESQVHTQYAGLTESYQQAEAALEVARHVRTPQHRELPHQQTQGADGRRLRRRRRRVQLHARLLRR